MQAFKRRYCARPDLNPLEKFAPASALLPLLLPEAPTVILSVEAAKSSDVAHIAESQPPRSSVVEMTTCCGGAGAHDTPSIGSLASKTDGEGSPESPLTRPDTSDTYAIPDLKPAFLEAIDGEKAPGQASNVPAGDTSSSVGGAAAQPATAHSSNLPATNPSTGSTASFAAGRGVQPSNPSASPNPAKAPVGLPTSGPVASPQGGQQSSGSVLYGSGGGGQPQPDAPPSFDFWQGDQPVPVMENGQPVPGQFLLPSPVPIGTVANFGAISPYGNGVNGGTIVSYSWSGGTDFGAYFGNPADQPPASSSQALYTNVATTNADYMFIIDSQPRQYTISVTVDYQTLGSGTATVKFSSVALPEAWLSSSSGTKFGRR